MIYLILTDKILIRHKKITNPEKPVLLINDKKVYNFLYRKDLINILNENGYTVTSLSFFDSALETISCLKNLIFKNKSIVISSNLKSNLICLLFRRGKCFLILNGLGRLRKSKVFRAFFLKVISFKSEVVLIVQNYADFRYLKLYTKSSSIYWIPGSGGVKRVSANNSAAILVQRDSKIKVVAKSVIEVFDVLESNTLINIIGCKDNQLIKALFKMAPIKNIGYVSQSDIFKNGSIFIQPHGYGEGFPHTLADAIMSDLRIFIPKKDFIQFGLHILGFGRYQLNDKWLELDINNSARKKISVIKINKDMIDIIVN